MLYHLYALVPKGGAVFSQPLKYCNSVELKADGDFSCAADAVPVLIAL